MNYKDCENLIFPFCCNRCACFSKQLIYFVIFPSNIISLNMG